MKEKIIKILKERGEINITDFYNLIPEIKGDYAMYMPVKKGYNENILWIAGVSQEFIKAINQLMIIEKIIEWEPVNVMFFVFDGSPIYDMDIATYNKILKNKKEYWLPIKLKLSKNKNHGNPGNKR
jgi:hypothetical protein